MFAEIGFEFRWERFGTPFMALLAADVAIILLNVTLQTMSFLDVIDKVPKVFQVSGDYSVGSFYNFAKWFVIAVIFFQIWRRDRQPIFAVLAGIHLYLFLDDSLEVHEHIGKLLARVFDLPAVYGLRPNDLGELLNWGGVGIAVVLALIFGFLRSSSHARIFSCAFILLFVVLAFFGIFLDAVHILTRQFAGLFGDFAEFLLAILEDGGEMVVASGMVAFALSYYRSPTKPAVGISS